MTGERVDDAQQWLSSVIAQGERFAGPLDPVPGAADSKTLVLDSTPESVRQAREFTRNGLAAWGLAAMYEDVGLVVSELVTNALRHAFTDETRGKPDALMTLGLLRAGGRQTCAVSDPGAGIPIQGDAGHAAQGGRGLHLVDALSDSWNWAPRYGQGKIVWACFSLPSAR